MNTIKVKFKPVAWFPLKLILYKELPTTWRDLTPKQFVKVREFWDEETKDAKLLKIFLGINKFTFRRIDKEIILNVKSQLSFMNEVIPAYDKFILRRIFLTYKPPKHNLEGISFRAFLLGDEYYQQHLNGVPGALEKFIVCFYNDIKGFDEKFIDRRSRVIQYASLEEKHAIALNYEMIRKWLIDTYPFTFLICKVVIQEHKHLKQIDVLEESVAMITKDIKTYAAEPMTKILGIINERFKKFIMNNPNAGNVYVYPFSKDKDGNPLMIKIDLTPAPGQKNYLN